MTKTFMFFIYLSTIIAVFSMLLVCASILLKASSKSRSSGVDLTSIYSQISICKRAGLVFTILEWFLFSCEKKSICLEGYAKLSIVCSRLSIVWIIFAFVCIMINMMLVIRKADSKIIEGVCKFRNSAFIMGAVYTFFAFILNVQ